ncbi:hypothetical protein GCM10027256_05070 [Novispirillum itersonii subsp. nipponicum]
MSGSTGCTQYRVAKVENPAQNIATSVRPKEEDRVRGTWGAVAVIVAILEAL